MVDVLIVVVRCVFIEYMLKYFSVLGLGDVNMVHVYKCTGIGVFEYWKEFVMG